MRSVELVAAARLDLGEALRSRWLSVYLILYALLGAAFLWVGLRESSVLGFTGSGRVLFSLAHALVLILPLLALLATGQAVNRSREDGSLELFLAQPIERSAYRPGSPSCAGARW
jgi:ABC-type transport system involved in multi-copper enzyme maturation permease subunit